VSKPNNLHDATLTEICVDWASGDFVAKFIVGYERKEVRINGIGLKSFVFSRQFRWGRSVSVNNAQIKSQNDGDMLNIEMQSGDEIACNADKFLFSD
jgi:hypothetical protein